MKRYAYFLAWLVGFAGASLEMLAQEQQVNVYSYRQAFLMAPIFAQFTNKTGIDVRIVYADKGLVARLEHEGRNSPADLLLTSDFARLAEAQRKDLLRKLRDPVLEKAVPAHLRDPEGRWFALTRRARVLYVAKERIPEGALTRYEQLADPKWRGRICIRPATHDYNIGLFSMLIAHNGEKATRQWLSGLRRNLARKPQGNDRAQVKAISENQCDIALGNSYYFGKMRADEQQKKWADSVRIVFPNQDSYGTHINISGIGLTRYAPNAENARELMRFLVGPEIQQFYAAENYEYPIREDIAWSQETESWGRFKADSLDFSEILSHRARALELVAETGINSGP